MTTRSWCLQKLMSILPLISCTKSKRSYHLICRSFSHDTVEISHHYGIHLTSSWCIISLISSYTYYPLIWLFCSFLFYLPTYLVILSFQVFLLPSSWYSVNMVFPVESLSVCGSIDSIFSELCRYSHLISCRVPRVFNCLLLLCMMNLTCSLSMPHSHITTLVESLYCCWFHNLLIVHASQPHNNIDWIFVLLLVS